MDFWDLKTQSTSPREGTSGHGLYISGSLKVLKLETIIKKIL
jgi:hypothetical protein